MPKFIVVQWVILLCSTEDESYAAEMRVVASTHPRFTVGSRFDYGFHDIAMKEGYVITHLPHGPLPKKEN